MDCVLIRLTGWRNIQNWAANGRSSHPEKGPNWVKLAQPVSCICASLPEATHPARVWDPAFSLQSLKFAVQPGPEMIYIWHHIAWIIRGLLTARLLPLPVSDVFCWCSSSSSDSAPCSRSLLPFSMLLLELPVEVWVTPNLHVEEYQRVLWMPSHRSQPEPHQHLSPTLFGI